MDFRQAIAAAVAPHAAMSESDLNAVIEIPPNPQLGNFALPCFKLAKTMRKAPAVIAAELMEKVTMPAFIDHVDVAGGYLNFFVDNTVLAKDVLEAVLRLGERYGSSGEGRGRCVCIDYSSINIAKPFHIGHLSTTVIGHALYNIYNFLGYRSVGINHLGDWGTQFGKLIVAFLRWGDKDEIEHGGVAAMLNIYVRFHEEAEKDPSLNEEARAWFKKIEDGDEQALCLFHWFKELTLKEVDKVYKLLGIEFDSYAGESFYNDKMGRVIDELKAKGLLVKDEGAWVVKFPEQDNMPPCLLLKADGATLYATRDIAAALYRKDTYDFYKCLYVVAYQQNLHFKQWFKVIEMMGYDWAKDLEHVAFGMVSLEGETLSTRKGNVVFLKDVFHKAIEKTLAVINEKSPELPNKQEVAEKVGVGAIVFAALSSGRIKDITFSWERALNFEGETGPYCQYTHARCCSVLSKASAPTKIDYSRLCDPQSQAVLKLLGEFPSAVLHAQAANEPFYVTRHVIELCKAYNRLYFEHRILNAPPAERDARLALTQATKTVIATGLTLIGVAAPERM